MSVLAIGDVSGRKVLVPELDYGLVHVVISGQLAAKPISFRDCVSSESSMTRQVYPSIAIPPCPSVFKNIVEPEPLTFQVALT